MNALSPEDLQGLTDEYGMTANAEQGMAPQAAPLRPPVLYPDADKPIEQPSAFSSALGGVGRGIGYFFTGNPYFLAKPQIDLQREANKKFGQKMRNNSALSDFQEASKDPAGDQMAQNLNALTDSIAGEQKPQSVASVREVEGPSSPSPQRASSKSALYQTPSPSQATSDFLKSFGDPSEQKEASDLMNQYKMISGNLLDVVAQTGGEEALRNWNTFHKTFWDMMNQRYSDRQKVLGKLADAYNDQVNYARKHDNRLDEIHATGEENRKMEGVRQTGRRAIVSLRTKEAGNKAKTQPLKELRSDLKMKQSELHLLENTVEINEDPAAKDYRENRIQQLREEINSVEPVYNKRMKEETGADIGGGGDAKAKTVRMSNGKEVYDVPASRVEDARKDGFSEVH